MKLVVLGAPGSGKGTQAGNLAKHYEIAHIATGDILRDHIRKETKLGLEVAEMIKAGQLIPDGIILELVRQRIQEPDCTRGFILDGFPRNMNQAAAMESFIRLDRVISLLVDNEMVRERMAGRVICPACGGLYHKIYHSPKREGVCDNCLEPLKQREDDHEEAVKSRLAVYYEQTEPIMQFYKEKGLLLEVWGEGGIEEITQAIIKQLGA